MKNSAYNNELRNKAYYENKLIIIYQIEQYNKQ